MDIALKQRLVGASVLIALAVIVLPMLLGGRPEDGGGAKQGIEIPEQPADLDFETRRFPVGAAASQPRPPVASEPIELPSPARPDALEQPAVASDQPDGDAAVADTERAPEAALPETGGGAFDEPPPSGAEQIAETEEPAVDVVESAPAAPVTTSAGGRYAVQVASFRSENNARRLSGQLKELGYGVLSDTVKSDVGTLHRVRVGPFASESEADRAVASLAGQLKDVKPRWFAGWCKWAVSPAPGTPTTWSPSCGSKARRRTRKRSAVVPARFTASVSGPSSSAKKRFAWMR